MRCLFLPLFSEEETTVKPCVPLRSCFNNVQVEKLRTPRDRRCIISSCAEPREYILKYHARTQPSRLYSKFKTVLKARGSASGSRAGLGHACKLWTLPILAPLMDSASSRVSDLGFEDWQTGKTPVRGAVAEIDWKSGEPCRTGLI